MVWIIVLKEDIIGDKIKLELNHNLNNINIDYDKISVTNDLIINTLYKLQKYLKNIITMLSFIIVVGGMQMEVNLIGCVMIVQIILKFITNIKH